MVGYEVGASGFWGEGEGFLEPALEGLLELGSFFGGGIGSGIGSEMGVQEVFVCKGIK